MPEPTAPSEIEFTQRRVSMAHAQASNTLGLVTFASEAVAARFGGRCATRPAGQALEKQSGIKTWVRL
jgi:hypothetical protein